MLYGPKMLKCSFQEKIIGTYQWGFSTTWAERSNLQEMENWECYYKGMVAYSMDSSLIINFIHFPIVNLVWYLIVTTYFNRTKISQVYDLKKCVIKMKQARGSIESFYNDLQCLWRKNWFWLSKPDEVCWWYTKV